jgi:hypothetical protein
MTRKVWVWTISLYILLMLPVAILTFLGVARRPNSDTVGAFLAAGFVFGWPLTIVGGVMMILEMVKSYEKAATFIKEWKVRK